jgi:hypothetical protein
MHVVSVFLRPLIIVGKFINSEPSVQIQENGGGAEMWRNQRNTHGAVHHVERRL